MIRLTRKDFRRWLWRHRRVIVGRPAEARQCPICRYLKSCGAKFVRIGIVSRTVDGQRHHHSKWQRDFQYKAIALERKLDVTGLRGQEALDILDGLD